MTPSREELYSRFKGLIENDVLMTKRVLVIGLGSFGSHIAVELAQAAVGRFALMDFDRLEVHNVVRHACFLKDIGRLKTDAVADLVMGKNPFAEVDKLLLCNHIAGEIRALERVHVAGAGLRALDRA